MLQQFDRDTFLDEIDRLKFAFENAAGGGADLAWREMQVAVRRLRAILPPDLDTADVEPSLLEEFVRFLDYLCDTYHLDANTGTIDYPVEKEFWDRVACFLPKLAPTSPEGDQGEREPDCQTVEETAAQADATIPSDKQQPVPGEEPKKRDGEKPIKFRNWAIGLGDDCWWLFQWFGNKKHWCDRGQIDIPSGDASKMAKSLAEHGSLDKHAAVQLFRTDDRQSKTEQAIFNGVCKHVRKRLAHVIKRVVSQAAGCGEIKDNPIPWTKDAWRAAIQIGYAGVDVENGKKLQFQTREQRDKDDFSGSFRPS